MYVSLVLTIILLAVSVFTDIRNRKIYNALTFPCMIIGLILAGFPTSSVSWIRFAWMVWLFFFGMLGLVGLGDLKLCMAVAALRGYLEMVWMVAFGGILMIIYLMFADRERMVQSLRGLLNSVTAGKNMIPKSDKKYPFAPFLAAGYVLSYLFVRFVL